MFISFLRKYAMEIIIIIIIIMLYKIHTNKEEFKTDNDGLNNAGLISINDKIISEENLEKIIKSNSIIDSDDSEEKICFNGNCVSQSKLDHIINNDQ